MSEQIGNAEEKSALEFRPHPDPLPQEREKRLPRYDDANLPGSQTLRSANEPSPANATTTIDLSSAPRRCPLSPGERGRVRAKERWPDRRRR